MKGQKKNNKFSLNLKDMDKILLFATIILLIFGLLNIVTASSREAFSQEVSIYHYFFRHSMMIFIGLVGFWFISKIETKKYDVLALFAYVVISVLLIYLLFKVDGFRGSKNWITLFGIKFQPSEFAKPVLIVSTAILFEKYYKKIRTLNKERLSYIGKVILLGIFFPCIVFLQKDLGTSVILLSIFGLIFVSGPLLRKDKVRLFIAIGIFLIAVIILFKFSGDKFLTAEQRDRLEYAKPCDKYETSGYQICNGLIAINDGGLNGLGIGKSKQKYSYIPEPHTDSVFAIIAEENGFSKCLLIFILYLIILYRILKISTNAKTLRNRYISLGVAVYIFMHIFINLGGLFVLLPLTGVPLPFLSYGGSFTITLICSIGIVERIAIENKNERIKVGEFL